MIRKSLDGTSGNRLRRGWLAVAATLLAPATAAMAQTPPDQPVIGSAYDNVTVSNPNVDGGSVAIGNGSSSMAATNAAVINKAITYVSSLGGGTVEIPAAASAYISSQILMKNGVYLKIDTGATLQNSAPTSTLIAVAGGASKDMEINGGGIINGNATTTSSNHLVLLGGISRLEVANVTIENSSAEHLVTEGDNNVTINNVTISDSKVLANTDGIDFAGSNFLIENCHIADGDDDIVAKPQNTYCSNIFITNDTITAGHGISIGGQTNKGLNGMYVSNITMNASASSPLEYGIHLKAGDGTTSATENGGLVQNVTFNNISINNVDDALAIDSFYNNGSNNHPGKPSDSSPFPAAPTDSTEPLWEGVTFENITVTGGSGNAAQLYGLNSSPANLDGVNFENVNITSADPWNMYYSSDVYMSGVTVNGATIPDSLANVKSGSETESQEYADTFDLSANAVYDPTPEPGTLSLVGAIGLSLLPRRRRAGRN